MNQITSQDNLALIKFGLKVTQEQRQQVFKQINSNTALKEQFEKIKKSLNTMINEDEFLESIKSSHQKISEIPENSKVIHVRDDTFIIRAINPQQIESLTERAFFNSFNLERILMKDIEYEEDNKRQSSLPIQQKKQQKQPQNGANKEQQIYEVQKALCICGKIKQRQVEWIQCANEVKCRGSSWYHLECSGLGNLNHEQLQNILYYCPYCKKEPGSDQPMGEITKRIKKN